MSNNVAVAFSNNDIGMVAWSYDKKIPRCLGFAVYRTDVQSGQRTALPAWVGFAGETNQSWDPKTTEQWPVQKFTWRDFEATRGHSYVYEIVPMIGKPGHLTPLTDQMLPTNQIQLSPALGNFSAYFNRGILSTQYLAHQIPKGKSGVPNYKVLKDRIDQPRDPLRNSLAGQSIEALLSLLNRAKAEGGECYCALYELNDPELLQALIGAPYVHLILSDAGKDDGTNAAARQSLHESGTDITDQFLDSGHIGHNKFVVYVDKQGTPRAVLSGSTNWTYTGLCTQSNNAIVIESTELASLYLDYWKRLKNDAAEQGQPFRKSNNQLFKATVDHSDVQLWFSPNTRQKTKPSKNPSAPSDMEQVFEVMRSAEQAILFLVFQPGTPSVIEQAALCEEDKPNLFIRGAATDPNAVGQFDVDLYHRSGAKPDASVVVASAVNDQFSFWQKELLKSSPMAHAIIHDKIVVVDPLSPKCAVITGSHNLGYRASYNNDENLLIISGNTALAKAYAVHVMDIYDHYRWRYRLQTQKRKKWKGLEKNDSWQDKYFSEGSAARREIDFWCGLNSHS